VGEMNEIQYAFIDEYGDYRFDFESNGVSTHFIVVFLLVKESNKEFLEQELERIRKQIGDSCDDHQLRYLNEVKDLPFTIYAYAIDKRKLREDSGIMHKTPFMKNVNRMIYEDLNRSFEQLDLVADEKETKLFLRGFKNYIQKRSIPDLFNYSTFGFNDSQSENLLELAGRIGKFLARGYHQHFSTTQYRSDLKTIKHKISAINLLPRDYTNYLFEYKSESPDSKYDELIIKQSVNLAFQYIEKYRKSDEEDEKLRIDFLKFLLFNLKENPLEYVYTQEILDNLNELRAIKINQHYFRSNIVSKLRDSGLLIASSNKGYKLPICLNDLYDFVNLSSLTIHPMIQRISKCREQILEATSHEIDILEQKEYDYLKKVIELKKGDRKAKHSI
jgi:hypothetical protein